MAQLPGEAPRSLQWDELSAQLDQWEKHKRRLFLPILFPLFGLLAFGNVFWWYQWRSANQQAQHTMHTTCVHRSDTVLQTTFVHHYDTVHIHHRTVHQRPMVQSGSEFHTALVAGTEKQQQEMVGRDHTGPFSVATPDPKNELVPADAKEARTIVRRVSLDSSSLAGIKTPTPDSQLLLEPPLQRMQPSADIKKSKDPGVYLARPQVGIKAGWGSPLLLHKVSGSIWGIGLTVDADITRRLRLGAAIQYWQGKLRADEADALKGIQVPDPGNDYKLRYWETYHLPALSYSLYLRYEWLQEGKWRPWIGLGGQAATLLPFEIEFDFENPNNNLEIFLPGQTSVITHLQGMLLMAGVENDLGGGYSWGMEGFWLQPVGKQTGILDKQLGLNTFLKYRF